MVPLSAGPFHLNDYVRYVQDFIRHLGPDVHVISVCQPTVPVLAAVSLMASANDPLPAAQHGDDGRPHRPAPVAHAGQSPGHDRPIRGSRTRSSTPCRRATRIGPQGLSGFAARRVHGHESRPPHEVALRLYLDLLRGDDSDAEAHRRFYDEYNAVLDMPAEFYLDTIRMVFQEVQLPNGTWEVDGKLVRPADIKQVALFTIEGELDDISGQGQTRAAIKLCKNIPADRKQHYTAPNCGHYGIFATLARDDLS